MIAGPILAPGRLGIELLRSAEFTAGKQEGIFTLSNEGLSTSALQEAIKTRLADFQEVIIFVDCLGSSYTAAKMVGGGAAVVTGMNLPMLLSFILKRDTVPLDRLVDILIDDGRKNIAHK